MSISRRDFLKLSGLTLTGAVIGGGALYESFKSERKLFGAKIKKITCPICSMGCGIDVYLKKNKIIHMEGDKSSSVNQGTLCAKAFSIIKLQENSKNLKSLYRAPYSTEYVESPVEESIERISRRVKSVRDQSFIEKENGSNVNYFDKILGVCGDNLSNEEAYLFNKFSRILGMKDVINENLFFKKNSDSVLESVFGLTASTNNWNDLINSDVVLILGDDPVETMPMLAKKLIELKNAGKKIITVDSSYTRTASISDVFVPILPGSLTVFINGLISFAINNQYVNIEYLSTYTNLSYLLEDNKLLKYKIDGRGNPEKDTDIRNSNSVYQYVKDFFSVYHPQKVKNETGVAIKDFLKVAEMFSDTNDRNKTGSIIFGNKISYGKSYEISLRSSSILQLLLGNIGLSGGGLYLSEAGGNYRGVRDQVGDFFSLPGYISLPVMLGKVRDDNLNQYLRNRIPVSSDKSSINKWKQLRRNMVNILKAWYGKNANSNNGYLFDYLPKMINDKNNYETDIINSLEKSSYTGALFMGADFINCGLNKEWLKEKLESFEWIVVIDNFYPETIDFWKELEKSSSTEVFFLPTSSFLENNTTFTTSDRSVFLNKSVIKQGSKKSKLEILNKIFIEIKNNYNEYGGAFPGAILKSNWEYSPNNRIYGEVTAELSGYKIEDKVLIKSYDDLNDDGKTMAGNWLYAGFKPSIEYDRYYWPGNSSILYEQAAFNRKGQPWNLKDKNFIKINKKPFDQTQYGLAKVFDMDNRYGPLPTHEEIPGTEAGNVKISSFIKRKNRIIDAYGVIKGDIEKEDLKKSFFEINKSLGEEYNLKNGDIVKIVTAFGVIKVPALLTGRVVPFEINNKIINCINLYGNDIYSLVSNNYDNMSIFKVKILIGVNEIV